MGLRQWDTRLEDRRLAGALSANNDALRQVDRVAADGGKGLLKLVDDTDEVGVHGGFGSAHPEGWMRMVAGRTRLPGRPGAIGEAERNSNTRHTCMRPYSSRAVWTAPPLAFLLGAGITCLAQGQCWGADTSGPAAAAPVGCVYGRRPRHLACTPAPSPSTSTSSSTIVRAVTRSVRGRRLPAV